MFSFWVNDIFAKKKALFDNSKPMRSC